jgi:hypothetical protein
MDALSIGTSLLGIPGKGGGSAILKGLKLQ